MKSLGGCVCQRKHSVAQVQELLLPVFRLGAELHKLLAQTLVCAGVPLDPRVNAIHQTFVAKTLQEGEHVRRCLMALPFGLELFCLKDINCLKLYRLFNVQFQQGSSS